MKNYSLIDYLGCILFKTLGPVLRVLPVEASLFLGRRIGDSLYYFDFKHRAKAYSNIRFALGSELSCEELSRLTRSFYQSLGQSIIEVFLIPSVDQHYIDKYIKIEGKEHVDAAFKKGKGVILVGVHAGSWELSNVISASLGFPFVLFVKDQKLPRLNHLLNSYRRNRGCRIITRDEGLRGLIGALKDNSAIGMVVDQGGKSGTPVNFFGRTASMPTGAIKLALKYGAALIPVFFTRLKGPRIKVWAGKEIHIEKSGNEVYDIKFNLQKVTAIYEDFIRKYPKEYLWSYGIWKHSEDRKILLLSDQKAGHLRQSQALFKIAQEVLASKNIKAESYTAEVVFKSKFFSFLFNIFLVFSGKYGCQGCLKCLGFFLTQKSYKTLLKLSPDMIISSGSSLAGVNYLLSRENFSKSIVIMKPALHRLNKFSLVVMQRHDHPPKRKNLVQIDGALNLIDEDYLKKNSEELVKSLGLKKEGFYIGLLIGGDAKGFRLSSLLISGLLKEVKSLSESLNAGILVTTSRRTSAEVEKVISSELKNDPRVKLLVIASKNNIPEAVGGILGLSSIVISSPESISMISEAVSSKRYTFVFKAPGLSHKHKDFLHNFALKKYIYLTKIISLKSTVIKVWNDKPPLALLKDNSSVAQSLRKLL